jgi:hypothetical protein
MMKALFIAALLFVGVATTGAQTTTAPEPAKNIDWKQLDPKVLDLAFDWLDDVNLQADAVDKSDLIYSPREADSTKLQGKLKRIATSPAELEVYHAVAVYYATVGIHRIYYDLFMQHRARMESLGASVDPADTAYSPDCSTEAIYELKGKTTARLNEIQKLYDAAQKRKSKSPVAR